MYGVIRVGTAQHRREKGGQGKGERGNRRKNTVLVIDTEPRGCGPDRPARLSEPNTDYSRQTLSKSIPFSSGNKMQQSHRKMP